MSSFTGETNLSSTPTPPTSQAKVSKRFPTTKLKFTSAPAIPISQMNPIHPSTTSPKKSLRSASIQLEWTRLKSTETESALRTGVQGNTNTQTSFTSMDPYVYLCQEDQPRRAALHEKQRSKLLQIGFQLLMKDLKHSSSLIPGEEHFPVLSLQQKQQQQQQQQQQQSSTTTPIALVRLGSDNTHKVYQVATSKNLFVSSSAVANILLNISVAKSMGILNVGDSLYLKQLVVNLNLRKAESEFHNICGTTIINMTNHSTAELSAVARGGEEITVADLQSLLPQDIINIAFHSKKVHDKDLFQLCKVAIATAESSSSKDIIGIIKYSKKVKDKNLLKLCVIAIAKEIRNENYFACKNAPREKKSYEWLAEMIRKELKLSKANYRKHLAFVLTTSQSKDLAKKEFCYQNSSWYNPNLTKEQNEINKLDMNYGDPIFSSSQQRTSQWYRDWDMGNDDIIPCFDKSSKDGIHYKLDPGTQRPDPIPIPFNFPELKTGHDNNVLGWYYDGTYLGPKKMKLDGWGVNHEYWGTKVEYINIENENGVPISVPIICWDDDVSKFDTSHFRFGRIGYKGKARSRTSNSSFERMRDAFYARNKEELNSIGKVVKTDLSRGVANRFLSVLSNPPLLGYHGTAARNQSNILNKGFLIPGRHKGGPSVEHGSAYGNGIYTAIKGNHWLSQGYTDNNELFVCGVADPHRSGVGLHQNVESEKKTSTIRSPSVLMSSLAQKKQMRVQKSAIRIQQNGGNSGRRGNFSSKNYNHKSTTRIKCRYRRRRRTKNSTKNNYPVFHHGQAMVTFEESRVAPLFKVSLNKNNNRYASTPWFLPSRTPKRTPKPKRELGWYYETVKDQFGFPTKKYHGPKTALVGGLPLGGAAPNNGQWDVGCDPRGGKRQSRKGEFLPDHADNFYRGRSYQKGARQFKDAQLTKKKSRRKRIAIEKKMMLKVEEF